MSEPAITPAASQASTPVARWGRWLHEKIVWALLASYALAAAAPAWGAAIRETPLHLPGGGTVRAPLAMLAVLLFCAAATIDWRQLSELWERPSTLALGLVLAWLGPALLVLAVGAAASVWPLPKEASGILLGLALVAAMPIANSSAAWTQNAGGNVALSLALVVTSIVLSPVVTPAMLQLMGWSLSPADTARIETLVREFSGAQFILWVILPSLAGGAWAWGVGRVRVAAAKPWLRIATLLTILVLNYASASLAAERLEGVDTTWQLLLAAALAAAVSLVGVALAWGQSRWTGAPSTSAIALLFGLSMKHTGLALVLAGEFLTDKPRAILVVLLTTLAQHVAASLVDRRLQRNVVGS